jgi:hypothetical protein
MSIFGLLGNGTVLYSSIRYNSIRLDKISLIFVKNLAVADILYTIFAIFPNFVTFSARRWVLGKGWCFVSAQLSFIPGYANIFIVLCITLYKLVMVMSPFTITRSITARIIVGTLWAKAVTLTFVVRFVFKAKSWFNPDNGTCMSSIYDEPSAKKVVTTFTVLTIMLPMLVIMLTNILLCVIAVRQSRSSNRVLSRRHQNGAEKRMRHSYRGLLMTCLLSGMFVVSWLPYIVYNSYKARTSVVSQELDILSFHCIFISSVGNPILYSLTNRRFGKYVRGIVQAVIHCDRRFDNRQVGFSRDRVRVRPSANDIIDEPV